MLNGVSDSPGNDEIATVLCNFVASGPPDKDGSQVYCATALQDIRLKTMASQLRCQAIRLTTMASQLCCMTALLAIRLTMRSQLYCAIALKAIRLKTMTSQLYTQGDRQRSLPTVLRDCVARHPFNSSGIAMIRPTTMASQLPCVTAFLVVRLTMGSQLYCTIVL